MNRTPIANDVAANPLASDLRAEPAVPVTECLALIDQLQGRLPGSVRLTTTERIHSSGRLRDGEVEAMRCILDALGCVERCEDC